MNPEKLISLAIEAMDKAYAPYSRCKVGAALLCKDGTVFTGCNIENAAYSPTNCAERTAIFKAVSEGHREFVAIAVCGGKDGILTGTFPPCGVCRQVLREFCDDDFVIHLAGADGSYESATLSQDERKAVMYPQFLSVEKGGNNTLLGAHFHRLCLNNDEYLAMLNAEIAEVMERYDGHFDGVFVDICWPGMCVCPSCIETMLAAGMDPTNSEDVYRHRRMVYHKYTR